MLNYEALLSDSVIPTRSTQTPILIVEDDRGLKMIFEWIIRDIDPSLTFHWCSSVEQAHRAMERNQYRLIISDFMLEGMGNGLDLWERNAVDGERAAFVMMSSLRLENFCKVGDKESSPRLVSKPIDVNQIQKIIRETVL